MSQTPLFGAWVRQRRKALGLTQVQLAKQVGCSHEMIRKIEADARRPSLQIAELLVRALEIPQSERELFVRAARIERPAVPDSTAQQDTTPRTLPEPPLFGRAELLAHLLDTLNEPATRLLTLAGPAGVGKTALATALASQHAGAVVVPLATVEEAEQVVPAIVAAVQLPERNTSAPFEQLTEWLRERRTLLVLDNLEQVAVVAAELVRLLQACPLLTLLVTSRVALRVPYEHLIVIPPLELPPLHATASEDVLHSPAVALFVARARQARPGFAPTPAALGPVAAICRAMDGLPLAIELVAARSNALEPQALLERLGGARGYAPLELAQTRQPQIDPRHQTLRDAIGWSVRLLSEPHQHLFAWLGVFRGGLNLAAAEEVVAANLRPVDVLDGVQALIDAHLVVQHAEAETLRFGMLVTIREYALELLVASGGLAEAQAAHARHYLNWALQMRQRLQQTGQEAVLETFEREHDNLRAALQWAIANDADMAARFGAYLWWFWYVRSHWREGYQWLAQILQATEPHFASIESAVVARLLRGAGVLAEELTNYQQASAWMTKSLQISRNEGNWQGLIATLNNLGGLLHMRGDSQQARECFDEALALSRQHEHHVGAATALGCLGSLATETRVFAEAHRFLDESLAIMQGLEYDFGVWSAQLYMAELARAEQDFTLAGTLYRHVLNEQRVHSNWQDVALALLGLGWIDLHHGQPHAALRQQQEALQLCHTHGLHQMRLLCLEGCAASAGTIGLLVAAQLAGTAETERERLGTPRQPQQQQAYEPALAWAASQHSPESWAAAYAQGVAMPLAQAVARALAV